LHDRVYSLLSLVQHSIKVDYGLSDPELVFSVLRSCLCGIKIVMSTLSIDNSVGARYDTDPFVESDMHLGEYRALPRGSMDALK
jgi:hypothetical protein